MNDEERLAAEEYLREEDTQRKRKRVVLIELDALILETEDKILGDLKD